MICSPRVGESPHIELLELLERAQGTGSGYSSNEQTSNLQSLVEKTHFLLYKLHQDNHFLLSTTPRYCWETLHGLFYRALVLWSLNESLREVQKKKICIGGKLLGSKVFVQDVDHKVQLSHRIFICKNDDSYHTGYCCYYQLCFFSRHLKFLLPPKANMDFKLNCQVCLKSLLEYIHAFSLVIWIFCGFSFNFNLLACDHSGCGWEKDGRKKRKGEKWVTGAVESVSGKSFLWVSKAFFLLFPCY